MRGQALVCIVDLLCGCAHSDVQVLQIPVWVCVAGEHAVACCHDNVAQIFLYQKVEAVDLLLHQPTHLHQHSLHEQFEQQCNLFKAETVMDTVVMCLDVSCVADVH